MKLDSKLLIAIAEALIQIAYRLQNPPKVAIAKLYAALEEIGARTPRNSSPSDPQTDNEQNSYPHKSPPPMYPEPPTPATQDQYITPEMADTLLQEARERQLRMREQRTKHRLPENILSDDPMRPENDLSDF